VDQAAFREAEHDVGVVIPDNLMGMNKIAVLVAGLLLLCACDRPECQNTNPVFDQHSIDSQAYLQELVKEIAKRDPDDLTYWMYNWEVRDYAQYMIVNVQGDGLCAQAFLTLPPDKPAYKGPKKDHSSAGGARGAQIIGLEYQVLQTNAGTVLLFQKYDDMID
jgi:hypothetical protein